MLNDLIAIGPQYWNAFHFLFRKTSCFEWIFPCWLCVVFLLAVTFISSSSRAVSIVRVWNVGREGSMKPRDDESAAVGNRKACRSEVKEEHCNCSRQATHLCSASMDHASPLWAEWANIPPVGRWSRPQPARGQQTYLEIEPKVSHRIHGCEIKYLVQKNSMCYVRRP